MDQQEQAKFFAERPRREGEAVTTCQKCGRERAQDIDVAFANHDRCAADVPGVVEERCQRLNDEAAKAAVESLLRFKLQDETIRVDSMRIERPGVLSVKAHRACPIALIAMEFAFGTEPSR